MSVDTQSLVFEVSSLSANAAGLQQFAEGAVNAIQRAVGNSRVGLVFRATATQEPVSALAQAKRRSGDPAFVFSHELRVRATSYGHLEIEVFEPGFPAAEFMIALEVIVDQLALAAERETLRWNVAQHAAEKEGVRSILRAGKAISRAVGVVSSERGLTAQAAAEWLNGEGERTRRSPWQVADMIMLRQHVKRA